MIRIASIITIICAFQLACQQTTKPTEETAVQDSTVSIQPNKKKVKVPESTEGNELPLVLGSLDEFEINTLPDSIEVLNVNENVVVAVGISDSQIEAQKEKYGEEDFYVVADDNMYYNYIFEELLDSVGIRIVRPESRFLKFIGSAGNYTIDLEKEGIDGLFWSYIVFNQVEPPQLIQNIIIEDASEISEYLERGEAPSSSSGQSVACYYSGKPISLGIGLIVPSSDEIKIFNDQELTDEYWTVNLSQIIDASQKCCPMYFKPDNGIMNFICLEDLENSYKILVNDSIIKYMPKDDTRKLMSWEDYVFSAMGIRRSTHDVSIQPEQNQFRTEPNENAQLVATPPGDYFSICPLEFQGEWIKVEINCRELCLDDPQEDCDSRTTAWIKWRSGEELLINIAMLS